MPELHKREKVLVQYRLLKDFDKLRRTGIPGIDVRVMEDNIYEWHVTMSPISGHFSGLRLHLVLLFPEDYPRRPPKVELCTYLPHANVFKDFLANMAAYWGGYKAKRGSYVICTDLLADKPPPLDPTDPRRYDGWSASYGVEAVLVQLQCLLFDDYIQSEDGNYINTLWDEWYSTPGQGRHRRNWVCSALHRAQKDADEFICQQCGFSGYDGRTGFYDKPPEVPELSEDGDAGEEGSDLEEEGEGGEEEEEEEDEAGAQEGVEEAQGDGEQAGEGKGDEDQAGEGEKKAKKKPKLVSRKKQKKLAHEKLRKGQSTKVDFQQQKLYMEISNSNSALISGRALRRVPGVFKMRDVVSFHFYGVEDEAYSNGHRNLNRNLLIFNYGTEVQFPWCVYDLTTKRYVYYRKKPEEAEKAETVNKGKTSWDRFVNSQGGGGKEKPEDTPGTEAFVKKRERFYASGVIDSVDPHNLTVDIVVAGEDCKLGACGGWVTQVGRYAWNSEGWNGDPKATLYKNVPMEKVKMHGYDKEVVPYEHEPPVNYKPLPGRYTDDERLPYDLSKDMPVQLIKLLAEGGGGLTKQKLATLPEGGPVLLDGLPSVSAASGSNDPAPASGPEQFRIGTPAASQSGSSSRADAHSLQRSLGPGDDLATENSFEIVSAIGDDAADGWEILSEAGRGSMGSFDIISVVEAGRSSSSQASVSSSFHVVPTAVVYALNTPASSAAPSVDPEGGESVAAGSAVLLESLSVSRGGSGSRRPSDAASEASSKISSHSLLSVSNVSVASRSSETHGSWQFLKVLCKLNIPVRGFLKSTPDFGAFFSIDATPRDVLVQNQKLLPSGPPRPKGKGKGGKGGKGKGKGEAEKLLEDGLLPCLNYMRPFWPPAASGEEAGSRRRSSSSVMVSGNILDDIAKQRDSGANSRDVSVYINDVDVERGRVRLSFQPRLSFEELQVGGEYEGIVVDVSRQQGVGLFVALSDDLTGLLHKTQLGVGAYSEEADENGWYKRSVYRVGDRVTVWVIRKTENAAAGANPRQRFKIDLTMDSACDEVQQRKLERFLQVHDESAAQKHEAGPPKTSGKSDMDLQIQQTYDKEDKFFLLKNNRLIQRAEQQYPELVIDYTTDPPPPPPAEEKEKFDFSPIEGWSVKKIIEEHKRLTDRNEDYKKASRDKAVKLQKDVKPLSQPEEKLLVVLQKKTEQWGNEYYERINKKLDLHAKWVQELQDKVKAERDKYPYKSIIDLDKFRELTERIQEKQYDRRSCFVTSLSYKEDVLGVGLEIVTEADTDRKVFQCSFDLISKEAFYDFGVRTGVWKDRIQFWMPAAIDSSHFRRALPYLARCFKELGDGRVEKLTRSYGTQAGSAKYNLNAQLREAERSGQKVMSLDEYRKAEAARKAKVSAPTPAPSKAAAASEQAPEGGPPAAIEPPPSVSLTEEDMSFGLEVLPKLMNLQTVQLMKGDLHLSTKALEGYMGFHHMLLSILRQYPNLQLQVERKIGSFVRNEDARVKKACPNLGEFLCLFAVSKKYTWDDVSKAILKETLDRNASWAIDKFPVLAGHGVSPETRLEKTFKASLVSIRLLCFNVWFLRNIVFQKYGEAATTASIVAEKLQGGPKKNCMDRRWEEYEERKGIPKPSEVNLLQEQIRSMMHGDGLNSWTDYFLHLNLKPLRGKELAQLLFMSLQDSVRKGYIPLWKLRPKPEKTKAPEKDDFLGNEMDKYS